MPTSEDLSELPSVADTIDVARENAEANVLTAVTTPKKLEPLSGQGMN